MSPQVNLQPLDTFIDNNRAFMTAYSELLSSTLEQLTQHYKYTELSEAEQQKLLEKVHQFDRDYDQVLGQYISGDAAVPLDMEAVFMLMNTADERFSHFSSISVASQNRSLLASQQHVGPEQHESDAGADGPGGRHI